MTATPKLKHGRLRVWLVWLSAVVVCGVAIAVFLTHRDQARQLWVGLRSLPVSTVVVALLLILGQVFGQALRFWAIIPRSNRVSVLSGTHAFAVGECLNLALPGRAGDAMKAVLMNRAGHGAGANLPGAAGAVLADKVIDIGSVVLLCAVTGVFGVLLAGAVSILPVLLAVVAGLAVAVTVTWLVQRAWFTKLRILAGGVVKGLSALTAPGPVLASAAFSLGAWVAEILALKVLCSGLGFSPTMSQMVIAIMILNAGVFVPIVAANVGVYEAALAFGLTQAGMPLAPAVAVAIAHHALELVALGLTTLGLSLAVRVAKPIVIPSPI